MQQILSGSAALRDFRQWTIEDAYPVDLIRRARLFITGNEARQSRYCCLWIIVNKVGGSRYRDCICGNEVRESRCWYFKGAAFIVGWRGWNRKGCSDGEI